MRLARCMIQELCVLIGNYIGTENRIFSVETNEGVVRQGCTDMCINLSPESDKARRSLARRLRRGGNVPDASCWDMFASISARVHSITAKLKVYHLFVCSCPKFTSSQVLYR